MFEKKNIKENKLETNMNRSEIKRERDESTLLSTMARVPLKSNFSINAILPEIAERDSPPEASPAPSPSATSDVDDMSSDGDVNVDYESENEGEHHKFKKKKISFIFKKWKK